MKKNRTLKILAVLIPVIFIGAMIYLFNRVQDKKERVDNLQQLPSFTVTSIEGATISAKDFSKGKKVLVYFSPECHICQTEAEELSNIYSKHPNVQWIFIGSDPIPEIKAFAERYQLYAKENIIWARDTDAKVYQVFGMSGVPYFLAYDENNKLAFRNSGAIKLENILKHFNE
ncbi:hypothetical protein BAX95_09375 [Elizabethkingia meningoseptica]|uniref:peroxiredoxin family protein n=1 Tax=Elizabethkingia meningoseptica TaxID=238 RepID=UPI00099950C9|nr:TlpA disulfide reductase family protein [Elizabethkingia meningoseptica]OPC20573.1 hypothetical protein BAX95_09375 [Elizabethkingia meningoseptica]